MAVLRRGGVAHEHAAERSKLIEGGMEEEEAWVRAWMWVKQRQGLVGLLDGEEEFLAPAPSAESERKPRKRGGKARSIIRGRTCPESRSIAWVADNIGSDDPDPRDCPSERAWGMLLWANGSAVNQSKFWERLYPLITPTREMMDAESRKVDDGDVDLRRLDEVARALEHARIDAAEYRRAAEGPVPAPSDGAAGPP